MKKSISLLLAAVLCLGLLAGCGGESAQPEPEQETSAEVYVSAFTPMRLQQDAEASVWAIAPKGVYAAVYEKLADGEPPEGIVPEYEGQYDVMGYRLYRIDDDGSARPLDYSSLPAPEDSEDRKNYSSSCTLERLFPAPDGGLIAVERLEENWYTGGDDVKQENFDEYWQYVENRSTVALRLLDGEGRERESRMLDIRDADRYLNLHSAVTDTQGNLYIALEQELCVFDLHGEELARIAADGWIYDMVRLKDGRVAVEIWDNGTRFLAADLQGQKLDRLAETDRFAERLMAGSGDYDFYYSNGTRLYGYRLETQEPEEVLDWLDCDLSAFGLAEAEIAADGTVRAVTWEDGEPPALVTLTKHPRDAVPERKILTMGTLYAGNISDAVLRFNRSQDAVRIRLRDYSDYVDGEDYEAGLQKLITEILAGDMPDLLSLDSLPYEQLAARGLLEDLYPYIDADPDMDRGDFFENVLHAMEVGGGLYQATPGFTIITIMGPSELVGDTPGWTYDDYDAAISEMPEGCTPLGPMVDRDLILQMCVYLSLGRFLDWGAGSCDFENEEFYRMLAFCSQFPKPENVIFEGESSDMSRIAEGRQLLLFTSIYSLDEAVYNDQYFQGKSTYIGLPVMSGTGNVLYPSAGYAMSASCSDKEAAWSFLRGFLTEEYQKKYSGRGEVGLCLNRKAFQAALDEAMKVEYERDAEGHYLLDADGERIPAPKGGMGVSVDGGAMMEFKLWAMTQEQADKLMEVIETSTRAADLNTYIFGIIRDEAAAYFAGQKSAEEVARLIQSKVNLYISEQR